MLQGAPEVHVQTGESLRLHCNVQGATERPQFIFWYHNGSMINYSPPRPLEVVRRHYTSDLYISDVRWEDAGAYSCEPEKAHPANLTLHVVAGKCECLWSCGVCFWRLSSGGGSGDDDYGDLRLEWRVDTVGRGRDKGKGRREQDDTVHGLRGKRCAEGGGCDIGGHVRRLWMENSTTSERCGWNGESNVMWATVKRGGRARDVVRGKRGRGQVGKTS